MAQARWTQQRRYPGDWMCEVVDGAGQPFDFGMDITECGIVKFLRALEPANSLHTAPRPWPGAVTGATSAHGGSKMSTAEG
jgi:hypothetical protein